MAFEEGDGDDGPAAVNPEERFFKKIQSRSNTVTEEDGTLDSTDLT